MWGKESTEDVCENQGLNLDTIKKELNKAVRDINVSTSLDFNDWDIDFMIDYIEYVHHNYLKKNLSVIEEMLKKLIRV